MNTKRTVAMAILGLGALAAAFVAFSKGQPSIPNSLAAKEADPKASASDAHADDDAAIRASSKEFIKALEKGDAKGIAAFWTEEGEYVADDGTTYRGRAAIEDAYAKFFAKNPKLRAEVQIDAIRFVAKDSAIEEGFVKTYSEKSKQPSSSRYSVLHVRDGGKWLM